MNFCQVNDHKESKSKISHQSQKATEHKAQDPQPSTSRPEIEYSEDEEMKVDSISSSRAKDKNDSEHADMTETENKTTKNTPISLRKRPTARAKRRTISNTSFTKLEFWITFCNLLKSSMKLNCNP